MSVQPVPQNFEGDRIAARNQFAIDACSNNPCKIRKIDCDTFSSNTGTQTIQCATCAVSGSLTTGAGATIGLNGVAAVAQCAAIADSTNTADSVSTQLNLLLAYLRLRGDIAAA